MSTSTYYDKALEASTFLQSKVPGPVHDVIVLGTGLGTLLQRIEIIQEIPYTIIPHFPISTVQSHKSKLIVAQLKGKQVLVMAGRFHYYEGYSMKEVTFPIRVFQLMGIQNVYLTNVAGGVNATYEKGDLVLIKDHINFMPDNPLRGANDERFGPRFPDMKDTYSKTLRTKAHEIAGTLDIKLKEGVYFGLPGPSLETPAEYEFIHRSAGDLVGMSTVPEAIVAKHAGLNLMAVSIVSNVCYPVDRIEETSVDEIIAVAERAESQLAKLLIALIP